jgi:molecular chaperone DnaK (HSP70)
VKKLGIGIDFGTTNSLAAVWGSDVLRVAGVNEPVVFGRDDTNRPHPSVVWLKPDNSVVVGHAARSKMEQLTGTHGNIFVRSVKRSLTSRTEWEHGGIRLKPYEIASEIFKHLKRDGEGRQVIQGHKFESCVVTVPVGFSGEQRREIRKAIDRADLKLQTFVHEPFAAMVAHFYHPEKKLSILQGKRVLVFDWGGGTLDICLVEGSKDGSTLYELSHDGIADRAGDDFDRRIMADLRGRFMARNPNLSNNEIDERCRAQDRFWINSESGKIELSKEMSVQIRVPDFLDGNPPLDLGEVLKRSEFEEMIASEVANAAACARRCLEKARITAAGVDYVLMVGGTSLIPGVQRELEQLFGAKVQVTAEPDAAIARGAAIVAAEEWQAVNAVTYGCEMARGEFFPLIKKGESLVKSASKKYTFFCTDPRDGSANFIFAKLPEGGGQAIPTGDILQVPVENERPSKYRDLDRLIVSASITEDCTLLVQVRHSGMGSSAQHEIADVSFGLKLK